MLWDQQLTIRTRKVIFKFPVCWFWEVFHLSSSIFSRWAQEPALAEISEVGWMKNHQLIRWNWWSHTLIFCLQVGFKLFSYLGFLLQVYDNSISLLLQLIFFCPERMQRPVCLVCLETGMNIWMPKFQRNTQGALVKRQIFGTLFWRSGAIWAMADDFILWSHGWCQHVQGWK